MTHQDESKAAQDLSPKLNKPAFDTHLESILEAVAGARLHLDASGYAALLASVQFKLKAELEALNKKT